MPVTDAPFELRGYRITSAAQRRGLLTICSLESTPEGRAFLAESLQASDCSPRLFERVRSSWRNQQGEQPLGCVKQVELQESDQRLTRVMAPAEGAALETQIFSRRFAVDDTLQTAISLVTCLVDWHRLKRIHGRLCGQSIYRDDHNRVELQAAAVDGLSPAPDFLSLDVADVVFHSPETSGSLKREIGPASDLYSVGVVLYGMLTGRPPLQAVNASHYLDRQLCVEAPRLRESDVAASQALDDIVARLLRRDPRDRYQTAAALLDDLQRVRTAEQQSPGSAAFAIGTQDIREKLTEATLVGRDSQLQTVQRSAEQVRAGAARFHVISGDELIGRRNFLDELSLRLRAQGLAVFRGGGWASNQPRPLQSLEAIIAGIAERCEQEAQFGARLADSMQLHTQTLSSLFPALAGSWPASQTSSGPDAYGTQRAEQALEALFLALSRETGGVALLFDNLEQADPLTRAVLASLADRVGQQQAGHLLCVVSQQSTDSPLIEAGSVSLHLGPLSAAALSLHLESTAGQLSESVKQMIVDASEGSPARASAILGRMIENGTVRPGVQGWQGSASLAEALRGDESIAELLQRQVEGLTPQATHLLASAAVLGRHFELRSLTYVAEVQYLDALEVATDALSRGLIWRDARPDGFQFAHDQIHEQLCETLDADEQKRLHLRAARYIEQQDADNVFALARHYHLAGQREQALHWSLAAADEARQKYDLPVALDQLEIAKRSVDLTDRQCGLRIAAGLGEIHLLTGRYDEAEACLHVALLMAEEPLQAANIQQQIGELAFKRGRFAEAAVDFERALASLGICVPYTTGGMLMFLLWQVARQGLHSLLPTRWIARRGSLGAIDRLRLQVLSRLSRVYWFSRNRLWTLGNHLRSLNVAETFEQSESLAAVYSEHGPVMSLLCWYGRAHRFLDQSYAIREARGDAWGRGQTTHYRSVVLLAECRFEDAIAATKKAVQLLRQTGDVWEMNMARYQGANALYRLGRLTEATEMAAEMFYSGRKIGDLQATGISLDVWARSSPQTLPLEIVEEEASRDRPDSQSHAQTQLAYAVKLLHHQRLEEGIEVLQGAIERSRKSGHQNTYISPCYAWLATAQRLRLEATEHRDGRRLQSRLQAARQSARKALRIAKHFPADLAHAYREQAILEAIAGHLRRSRRAAHASLNAARRYHQPLDELEALRLLSTLQSQHPRPHGGLSKSLQHRLEQLESKFSPHSPVDPEFESGSSNLSLADRFVTVLQFGRRIAQALSADVVFSETSEAARRLLRGQHIHFISVRHGADPIVLGPHRVSRGDEGIQQRIDRDRSLILSALQRETATCRERGDDSSSSTTAIARAPAANTLAASTSGLAAPIAVRGEIVAVLLATHDELGDLFGDDELRIANFVCTLAGAALENADGFLQLQQMNETLEQRVRERTQAAEDRAGQLADSNRQLRRTEEQLRDAIAKANAASEAKSRFLATMSHEIRTPLNGILGMSRLAQQAPAGDRQEGYLATLEESGQSLLTLINDLLDFSKLEAGKVELERIAIDPEQLLGEVSRLMSASAWHRNVQLSYTIDPDLPPAFWGDPARLRQILINLVGNAIKFTEQGTISISARAVTPLRPTVAIGSSTPQRPAKPACQGIPGNVFPHELWIAVQDTGIGIPADKQERIFESFSQADSSTTRRYGGTGLGLAICRELAAVMGGWIDLHSQVGVGSTFTLRLPLQPAEESEPVAPPAPPTIQLPPPPAVNARRPTDPNQRTNPDKPAHAATPTADESPTADDSLTAARSATRILVAEDGLINQEVIIGILQMQGYQVLLANDGLEAVERSQTAAIDLCLMDVDMPNLDGIEATKRIRQHEAEGARLPIIAMTAHSSQQIGTACREAGMDAHLSKPIQPDALFAAIERFTTQTPAVASIREDFDFQPAHDAQNRI
ncbi:ATP-binding protein [Roseimaritima ulvae]|uniref:histidine kinase n=1 Tax=Roseimaritima ulvae TaxID=980254 RepID=A0A5B9R8N5_9BACT|nr:ATP-binding protein [Roseimaritima ulvae]QEG43013.1 Sensory/regulatory protein RpfC [Roseimaritima ulvae]